ncbi:MAG: glycosyltransferase family 4 protein [Streptococcaceae bacterium]|jgi:glycosyltransferase involved in cell wall biosynthesis|nr:glycosyltransferase family 4 protein [Streptococcaceae bacterium]
MKTVAFFSGYYLPYLGGIERYTSNIAQELIKRGYRVIIVTSQYEKTLKNEERVDGVMVYRLPVYSLAKGRYPLLKRNKLFQELCAKIRAEKIDVFIANTRFHLPALLGVRLAKEVGKEALVIEHGTSWLTWNQKLLDLGLHFIERRLMSYVKRRTSRFYGVSIEAADWLKNFGVSAIGVLSNAVAREDFERFSRPKKGDGIVLTYSGRLLRSKGIETLLSAFVKLSEESENLSLVINGDGPLYENLKASYPQASIHFSGLVSHEEVMKTNAEADIFVLLSKIEGFSTAMLEAALMKNVIITTELGGARELMPDSSYGYIIENSETALVATLRELVSDVEKMREIQERVSKRVRDFYTTNCQVKCND